jgi:hypothetical protein
MAASDSRSVRHDDLPKFATYLARAGLFKESRVVVQRARDSFERGLAEKEIAVIQVATEAWADPQHVKSFAPVDALGEPSGDDASMATAGNYWLLAEQIINRSPISLVSPELSKLLHVKVLRREPNATLRNLLYTRWPNKIASLPEMRQGRY